MAAMPPRSGSQVDHMIGGANGVFVVLHHQHRIPQVAKLPQGVQQLLVVPLVQTYRGLVQNVKHTHQP
jgi:hypothetical protein